jgi:hypothetical protein
VFTVEQFPQWPPPAPVLCSHLVRLRNSYVVFNCQYTGLFKKNYTLSKILQVLLNIWRLAIYRLKGELCYFHTLQALDESHTCDVADVKSIIQLFPHSSQHVTSNSSHSLSDAPLQIIDIRILRDLLSIRTQGMDLTSVVFVK